MKGIKHMYLFNSDRTLNMPEFVSRLKYWTEYARTGVPKDVEIALTCLSLLAKLLEREVKVN